MDSFKDLQNVLDEVEHSSKRGPSVEALRSYLRLVRELKVRQSEKVAKYGLLLLRKHAKSLPEEELWTVYEQVAIACMDCQTFDVAHTLVDLIVKKFPSSNRATRVMGMFYEATGRPEKAMEVYSGVLEDNPSEELILKRMVAVKKAAGDLAGAIESLKGYLEMAPLDKSAWEEMAELYLQMQMYQQAAFCYEEVLLHNPSNPLLQMKYADVLYTIGGAANLRTARTYYSAAIQLTNGSNLRALWGAVATCAALRNERQARSSADDDHNVGRLSADMIVQRYRFECPGKLLFVKKTLKELGYAT